MHAPALIASRLSVGYPGAHPILADLDFSFYPGQLILLLGINGIGKSTLLRTLSALLTPHSGTVTILDTDIHASDIRQRSRLISAVFTRRDYDAFITVREAVSLGRHPHTDWLGSFSDTDQVIIERAISLMGITHLAHRTLSRISDGEKQKVAIAKAIAQNCPFLLMDEPTAFLDFRNKELLMRSLQQLAHQEHRAILISTHDIDMALAFADRALLITEQHTMIEAPQMTAEAIKSILASPAQI